VTGELVTVERDGTRETVRMVRPDPPDSDVIVKKTHTWRREYHYTGTDENGFPVYEAR
jgi:hypothetical protein